MQNPLYDDLQNRIEKLEKQHSIDIIIQQPTDTTTQELAKTKRIQLLERRILSDSKNTKEEQNELKLLLYLS